LQSILRAFSTISCDFLPFKFATNPIPQLSCSNSDRYNPSGLFLLSIIIKRVGGSLSQLPGEQEINYLF
jgi:hypothetical protein